MLIVFVDGGCGICTRLALFLKRIDKKKQLEIHSLNSKLAKSLFSKEYKSLLALESIVVLEGQNRFYYSKAIFKIIDNLPYFWRIFIIFRLLPDKFTFFLYKFVARNRSILSRGRNTNSCKSVG